MNLSVVKPYPDLFVNVNGNAGTENVSSAGFAEIS